MSKRLVFRTALPSIAFLFSLSRNLPAATAAESRPTPGTVEVAALDEQPILGEELLREARFLADDERHFRERAGIALADSVRDWAKRIALRRIVAATDEPAADAAESARMARAAVVSWAISRLERRCFDYERPPQERGAVAAELAANAPPRPPRVRLSQIFLAAHTDEEAAVAALRLEQVRAEVGGDRTRFRERSEAMTESSMARRDGALGWIFRGWIDPVAEVAVFAAAPGEIVGPVRTRAGLHLFYIEARDDGGRQVSPQAIERELVKRESARLAACRTDRLAAVRAALPAGDGGSDDESLFGEAIASSRFTADERARFADIELDVRLGRAISAAIGAELDATEPTSEALEVELERLYGASPDGFLTPARLRVTLLSLPIDRGSDPLELRDRLRADARRLRDGETSWESVANDLGPAALLERLPELSTIELAGRIGPPLFERLLPQPIGFVSEPVQDRDRLYLGQVESLAKARPMTYSEARPAIAAERTRDRRRVLAGEITAGWLDRHRFRWRADADAAIALVAGEIERERKGSA